MIESAEPPTTPPRPGQPYPPPIIPAEEPVEQPLEDDEKTA